MNNSSIYEIVTCSIVESLKNGVAPWRAQWDTGVPPMGSHKNVISNQRYLGANTFLTAFVAQKKNYTSANWGTFKQWSGLERRIAKGEKGCPVLYFKNLERKNSKGEIENIPVVRYFVIFNESQLENYENPTQTNREHYPIEKAESVLIESPLSSIDFRVGNPAYSPSLDYISMP